MKTKIIGLFVCALLVATAVPAVGSLDTRTVTTTPTSSNALRNAFIWGRYSNLTGGGGYITIKAVNMKAIFKDPFSFTHFPKGTTITFVMYTAYGHMFQKINFLYLHVELVV